MNSVNATYAKQNFGACIADASKEPLIIEKSGRPSVVMIAYEEYRRLRDLEDSVWLQRARAAAAGGYLSPEESENALRKRLVKITACEQQSTRLGKKA